MSYLTPTKNDVQGAMYGVAAVLEEKLKTLREFADSIGEASDEECAAYFGNEYSGPGSFRQWSEVVEKATTFRASETNNFERALSEYFGRCQREAAVKAAEEKAAAAATEFAESQSKDR